MQIFLLQIVQVRDPFERLVSAYENKLVPGARGNTEYFANMSKKFYDEFHPNASKNESRYASFTDFVKYLLQSKSKEANEYHWASYDKVCQPCKVQFDYIVKFETLYEDIEYLKIKLNISKHHQEIFFPPRQIKTNTNTVQKYFKELPKSLIRRLYARYMKDFHLFGYKMPSILCDSS